MVHGMNLQIQLILIIKCLDIWKVMPLCLVVSALLLVNKFFRAKLTCSSLHSVHPVPLLKFGRVAT